MFSQHTGRESRELQASFIPVISGHSSITPGIMRAFRAIMDFIYIAQFDVQSTITISHLQDALACFHANKIYISRAGVRDGPQRLGEFNINKIELMQNVAPAIPEVGSLPQFSSEQIEHCHISMAKIPYRATNKKDHEEQVCRNLDRQEKIYLFEMYLQYRVILDTEEDAGEDAPSFAFAAEEGGDPEALNEECVNPLARSFLSKPVRDAFADDANYIPHNETTTFILTSRITRGNAKVAAISIVYELPNLRTLLDRFWDRERRVRTRRPIKLIDCWDRVRLQLRSVDKEGCVLQPVTVMACPPSDELPFGLYNFVLVKAPEHSSTGVFHGELAVSDAVFSFLLN